MVGETSCEMNRCCVLYISMFVLNEKVKGIVISVC